MNLFLEAGLFAWGAFAVFLIGLVVLVRSKKNAVLNAVVLAVSILALGEVGAGVGQRLVATAVQNIASLDEKVLVLSMGTKEAAANHLVAGTLAFVLVAIAVAVVGSRRSS